MEHIVIECPQCGAQGTKDRHVVGRALTCPKCGSTFVVQASATRPLPASVPVESPPPTAQEPAPDTNSVPAGRDPVPPHPTDPVWKRPWALVLAALGLTVFIVLMASDFGAVTSSEHPTPPSASKSGEVAGATSDTELGSQPAALSIVELYAQAQPVSYEDLARDPDRMTGTLVVFTGEVVQVIESEDAQELRVALTEGEYGWQDDILVTYTRPEGAVRILEGDIITGWGTADGLVTYETVAGAEVTVPAVQAMRIRLADDGDTLPMHGTATIGPWRLAATEVKHFHRTRYWVVDPGKEHLTFTLTVTNTGTTAATPSFAAGIITATGMVVCEDSVIERGSPSGGPLAPGQSDTLTITFQGVPTTREGLALQLTTDTSHWFNNEPLDPASCATIPL